MTEKRLKINQGDRYGRWSVISEFGISSRKNKRKFLCRCDCGNERVVLLHELRRGNSTSCGCLQKEVAKKQMTTHGKTKTRTYNVWISMRKRCLNPNHKSYNDYGGRGITICNKWLDNFENFLDDMGESPNGKSLDRIDNNKGYYKDNCRWSSWKEQANNRRNSKIINFNGKSMCCSDWEKELNFGSGLIGKRLKNGWGMNKILTTPAKPIRVKFEYMGQIKTLSEWSKFLGISSHTLYDRLHVQKLSINESFNKK